MLAPAHGIQENQVAAAMARGKPAGDGHAQRLQPVGDDPLPLLLSGMRCRRAARDHLADVACLRTCPCAWKLTDAHKA
jgi:hypothetical protein